ncbi:MAG: hypothetical protein NT033_00235 [Candidatus Omnitrophica bacterium]|nr:hypothetical protein [Candidatus Omnitrophota bacterium]
MTAIAHKKILCLFVRYGIEKYPHSLEVLTAWYAKNHLDASVSFWIIDNKIKDMNDNTVDDLGCRLISGDNTYGEFSAWQKIVDEYSEEIKGYKIVHFVTDAFNTLYTGYLDDFSKKHLDFVANRPVCLGHIDSYDNKIEILGHESQSWVRTCFFFMSTATLFGCPDLVSIKEESLFFDKESFRRNAPMSENYKKYIKDWLFGKEIQGVRWHSIIKDEAHFKKKALAILNEHMLSINLRIRGISTIDFRW